MFEILNSEKLLFLATGISNLQRSCRKICRQTKMTAVLLTFKFLNGQNSFSVTYSNSTQSHNTRKICLCFSTYDWGRTSLSNCITFKDIFLTLQTRFFSPSSLHREKSLIYCCVCGEKEKTFLGKLALRFERERFRSCFIQLELMVCFYLRQPNEKIFISEDCREF